MARLARVVLPGHPHHVTQRGVRSMDVFRSRDERDQYLHLLAVQSGRAGLEILSWCLMTNHVHLVVVPESSDSIARGVGEAHRRYTLEVNRREKARGHLFQERFFSCPMDEPHFIAAVRYVERNPVRAGVVADPWHYEWSSARFHLDGRRTDRLVSTREPFGMALDWHTLLAGDPGEVDRIRASTRTGRPLGCDEFVDMAERITGRELRPRTRGRRPSRARRR